MFYKYYFPDLNINDSKLLNKIKILKKQNYTTEKSEILVLTNEGLFKQYLKKNEVQYCLLMYQNCDFKVLNNYVNNKQIICCLDNWKKDNLISKIPEINKLINLNKIMIDSKSSLSTLVLEYYDNKLNQLYLTSEKNYDDELIKKDVGYFCEMLM